MTLADTFRQLSLSAPDARSDGELVSRFVGTRDEPAFAELLRRHGPTVYGVCRRILGSEPDADDAFQAVFLVLARKANTIRPPGMVGNWLYGVAVRTANKARVMNARRVNRRRESPGGLDQYPATHVAGSPDAETLAVIDAELAALPAVYRAAFVACELNGRSRSEAARDLGWPEGTVAARLAKARELLAARLRKRGVTLGVGLFAAVAVPQVTAADALAAVRELLAVGMATAVAPAAQQLSDEVVNTMTTIKLKLVAVGLLAITLAAGGAALVAGSGEQPGPRAERHARPNAPVPKAASEWKEAKPITFTDGGRVTSVAVSPSGKTLAVCRDTGKIDFYHPVTRKHITTMDVGGEKGVAVATITALTFSPTSHPKHGDMFAVTHKNGVRIGTVGLGLFTDDAAKVEGIPPNWKQKDFDPHQLTWLSDESVLATNGEATKYRQLRTDALVEAGFMGWKAYRHQPTALAAIPNRDAMLFRFDNEFGTPDPNDRFDLWCAEPMGKVEDPEKWRRLSGHKSRPVAAAVAKDGKRVVTADEGGTLIVWDGEKFKEQSRIELGRGVIQLALAPDGKTVAVLRTESLDWLGAPANRSGEVFELFVFDITNPPAKPTPLWKNEARSLPGKRSGPASLAFGPDGKTLLAAFADPYTDDAKLYGPIPKSLGVKVWELVPTK